MTSQGEKSESDQLAGEGVTDGQNGTGNETGSGPELDPNSEELSGNATPATSVGGSPYLEAYFLKCVADGTNVPQRTGMDSYGCSMQHLTSPEFKALSFFLPMIARDLGVTEANNVTKPLAANAYDNVLRPMTSQFEEISTTMGPYHWHVWVSTAALVKPTITLVFGGGGRQLSRAAVPLDATPKVAYGKTDDYHFGNQASITKASLGVPADWRVELQPLIEKKLRRLEIPITSPGGNVSVGVRLDGLLGVNLPLNRYELGCYDNQGNPYFPAGGGLTPQGTLFVQSAHLVLSTTCQNSGNTEVHAKLIVEWQGDQNPDPADPNDDYVVSQINFFSEQNIVVPAESGWTKVYVP